jgi:hypothetical protein
VDFLIHCRWYRLFLNGKTWKQTINSTEKNGDQQETNCVIYIESIRKCCISLIVTVSTLNFWQRFDCRYIFWFLFDQYQQISTNLRLIELEILADEIIVFFDKYFHCHGPKLTPRFWWNDIREGPTKANVKQWILLIPENNEPCSQNLNEFHEGIFE